MKLSIIIVNFNTKDLTFKCLKSLEKHPLGEDFEVILVDNGSTDGSVEFFKKFSTKKFEFLFLHNNENLGFSKGNNIGLKNSKGEYKLLLNSDTEVTKNALNRLVETAEKRTDAGVIGARLLNPDESIQESVFKLPTVSRSFRQYWLGEKNILNKYYPKSKNEIEVEVVVGAAFLITPRAMEKVGLLNEKYFMYFEDFDYCREARKSGLKVYYDPNSKIVHHHGASKGEWKKLVSSSKKYHGLLVYWLIFLITFTSQKFKKYVFKNK